MVLLARMNYATMEIRLDALKTVSLTLAILALPESVTNLNVSHSAVMEFELPMKFVTVVNCQDVEHVRQFKQVILVQDKLEVYQHASQYAEMGLKQSISNAIIRVHQAALKVASQKLGIHTKTEFQKLHVGIQ